MLTLAEYLDAKRVSDLQEVFEFWSAGERAPGTKGELVTALTRSMQDEQTVHRKIKLLSRAPMQLLLIMIRSDDYRADVQSAFYNDFGIHLEYYEVEAAARALARRGFLDISRDKNWARYGREVYSVPREVGETVSLLLAEERRGPREVFTLSGHLTGISPQKLSALLRRLGFERNGGGPPALDQVERFLIEEKGTRALLDSLSNHKLRDLLARLIEEYGGVISKSRYESEVGAPITWDRKRWQRFVEGSGLGTISNLTLDDYGILFEGESIVLFKELVEGYFRSLQRNGQEFERVAGVRIDLLTDLAYFLRFVGRNPVKVTQAKTLYRTAQAKIRAGMVFKETDIVDQEEVLHLIWDLARGLELVTTSEERIVKLATKGEAWESGDLLEQVKAIYDWMLEERAPDSKDFHLRKLRRHLAGRLTRIGSNRWRPLRELPFLARNDYLAGLEEEGIRERYRNRYQYTYDPPQSTLPQMSEELTDWIVHRLFVLGFVELGMGGGTPTAVRLTELGLKVLGLEGVTGHGNGRAPLVVNPDFEVLVFPEGDVLELVHTLDRFATRTKSEEVSHYRIQKEGVERAVVKGMPPEDILSFLEEHSRTPIPQNVAYSVRDWAAKICFASQREVVLLTLSNEDVMDRVLALERVHEMLVERVSPTAAALKGRIEDWRTLEDLRGLGVYIG